MFTWMDVNPERGMMVIVRQVLHMFAKPWPHLITQTHLRCPNARNLITKIIWNSMVFVINGLMSLKHGMRQKNFVKIKTHISFLFLIHLSRPMPLQKYKPICHGLVWIIKRYAYWKVPIDNKKNCNSFDVFGVTIFSITLSFQNHALFTWSDGWPNTFINLSP